MTEPLARARARLVPELVVRDLAASLGLYTGPLGFRVLYDRPEDGFAYLDREGAELMLEQIDPESWLTAEMEPPFGRGINLQIEVSDISALATALREAGITPWLPLEDAWYRTGSTWSGNRQLIVQDPDGYLLRFFQDLGERTEPSAGRAVG